MSTHRSLAALIVLVALAGGACASAPKLPLFGTWRIQPLTGAGVPAQTSVQNLAWVGVSASFQPGDARVGANHCYQPTYTAQTISAAEFQGTYTAPPASLGLQGDPITLYKLTCGHEWHGEADTLIVKSPTLLLSRWNGMFFELVQAPPALNKK
jgi:hypothetical protein